MPPGVQGLDRYAYVNNNPLRYVDPTGHMCSDPEDPSPSCENGSSYPTNSTPSWTPTISNYGVTVNGGANNDLNQIELELATMADVLAGLVCTIQGDECSVTPAHMTFNNIFGNTTINILGSDNGKNYCVASTTMVINCYGFANQLTNQFGLITHEYGHLLNYLSPPGRDDGSNYTDTMIEVAIEGTAIFTASGDFVTGYHDGSYERTVRGYGIVHHPLTWLPGGIRGYEEFSDMWMNYVYNSFSTDKEGFGDARYGWMQNFMPLAVSWVMP